MARHTIPITNGKGSIELVNGNYRATVVANGYDASTLNPKEISIVEGTAADELPHQGDPRHQILGHRLQRLEKCGNVRILGVVRVGVCDI